jgi:hypothetical protein
MNSYPVGPADIELPPTEPIDISWTLETTTTTTNSQSERGLKVADFEGFSESTY